MKKFAQSLKARLAPVAATGSALVAVSGGALASGGGGGVDVGDVVSAIQAAAAPIAQIGSAVLIVLVGIKVYKWVRRAF
ncbi:major capsid protein [Stenotrophomonas sp. JC08]|uniref:major capsid protein n=1 Tax=Stenotrophomonas sp. JC08 TaxID=3445779 RepID=UPI003FA2B25B